MTSTLTHPEWNQETSGLVVAEAFADQIRGKNVLITGISPLSIGSSIAHCIASQAPSLVILASRTKSKLEEVQKSIHNAYPNVKVETVILDLISQNSVHEAAANVESITNKLDLLINNAGFMVQQRQWTKEGIEGQFGANHIGHFLLTNLLMPLLTSSSSARVINLTSIGHKLSPVRFSDYNLEKLEHPDAVPEEERHAPLPPGFAKGTYDGYNGWIAYGQSKTANILFSVGLNERMAGKGVRSFAVHPGSIWTDLSRNLDADGEAAIRNTSGFWKNLDQGAATVLVAALDPALNEAEGVYMYDCQMGDAMPYATDSKLAERLWEFSEKLSGITGPGGIK